MFFADLQPRIYGFVKRESEFWLWLPTLKKKKKELSVLYFKNLIENQNE